MGETTDHDALKTAGVKHAERHLFICIGPDCCSSEQGERIWKHAKRRIRDLGIPVMRTKAGCFRICQNGPWMVVYPDGIWYNRLSPERFDRILEEHIIGNRPVVEWIAATNPLATHPDPPVQTPDGKPLSGNRTGEIR